MIHHCEVPINFWPYVELLINSTIEPIIDNSTVSKNPILDITDVVFKGEGLCQWVESLDLHESGEEVFLGHQIRFFVRTIPFKHQISLLLRGSNCEK